MIMRKTILSLTVATILGMSLTGCGGGAAKSPQEIVDDALNYTKQDSSVDNTVLNKLSKNYDGKYLPLYDAQNDNMQAIRLHDNMTKVDLYDVVSGAVLTQNATVTISADGKTLTLKNLHGQNQDLVLDIVKKDGGEFLTKGNTTWDTGITCDSVAEVEEKLEVIVADIKQDILDRLKQDEPQSDVGKYSALIGKTYQLNKIPYEAEDYEGNVFPIGDIEFGKNTVKITVDGEVVLDGYYKKSEFLISEVWDTSTQEWVDVIDECLVLMTKNHEELIVIESDLRADYPTFMVYNAKNTENINTEGSLGDILFDKLEYGVFMPIEEDEQDATGLLTTLIFIPQ